MIILAYWFLINSFIYIKSDLKAFIKFKVATIKAHLLFSISFELLNSNLKSNLKLYQRHNFNVQITK